jgi:hypothetical protein
MMSVEEAERLARQFLDVFGEDAHFLTNGSFELSADAITGLNLAALNSWTPVTQLEALVFNKITEAGIF